MLFSSALVMACKRVTSTKARSQPCPDMLSLQSDIHVLVICTVQNNITSLLLLHQQNCNLHVNYYKFDSWSRLDFNRYNFYIVIASFELYNQSTNIELPETSLKTKEDLIHRRRAEQRENPGCWHGLKASLPRFGETTKCPRQAPELKQTA